MTEQPNRDILISFIPTARKKKFIAQPHNLLLITALSALLIPLFFWVQGLYVYIGKVGIFTTSDFFIYSVSLMFMLFWLVYRATNKFLLTNYLTWTHVVITLFVFAYFFVTGLWYLKMLKKDELSAFFMKSILNNKTRSIRFISVPGIIFLTGQFLYGVNLIGGIIQKNKEKDI